MRGLLHELGLTAYAAASRIIRKRRGGLVARKSRSNQAQKEGFARVFDGFAIAGGIGFFTFFGNHNIMSGFEAVEVLIGVFSSLAMAYIIRKE